MRATYRKPRRRIPRLRPDWMMTGTAADLIGAIASGTATTRADLARFLGLAPSTVTVRVASLLEAGVLAETGSMTETRGRSSRVLEVSNHPSGIWVADLGSKHARIGQIAWTGQLLDWFELPIDTAAGPEAVLGHLLQQVRQVADTDIRVLGLAVPGPVDVVSGTMRMPSRMPEWDGFSFSRWFADMHGVSAVVDNEANLMALGEYSYRLQQLGEQGPNTMFIKLGRAIGSGLVLNGSVYRGSSALAGDMTHVRVPEAGDRLCSCGNTGCLDTLASGSAIREMIQELGHDWDITWEHLRRELLPPELTAILRSAGTAFGAKVSVVVNYLNPDLVVLGGSLSGSGDYFEAAAKAIVGGCHAGVAEQLRIEHPVTGADAGLLGAGQLALRRVLAEIGV